MYYLIDEQNQICGESLDIFPIEPPLRLVAKSDWQPDPQAALAAAKAAKLQAAAQTAQAFIEQVAGLASVPQFERDSWGQQAAEVNAWAADNSAATPILAGIARARGVPLDELRQKALAKTRAFAALTASVAGQRQALEDRIRAANDLTTLDAIAIAYRPPMIPMMPAAPAGGEA